MTSPFTDPPAPPDRHSTRVEHPDVIFLGLRADLVRQATRIVGSASEAEDIAQEVWLRWRRHQATVESPSRWLRTVTRNLALDSLRRQAAHREDDLDGDPAVPAVQERGFGRVESVTSVTRGLRVVLGSLSEVERVVFVLREALDWPHADIARLIGRSEPAVRQLQHRAARHVAAASDRFEVSTKALALVSEAFTTLDSGGDVASFLDVLAPDVTRVAPGMRDVNGQVVHEVAGILLVTHEPRLLLCHRRPDLSWYPDVWDVAGSHLHDGEPPAACAVRAARHKLRISVVEPTPIGQFDDDSVRISMFCATQWEGTPRNPHGAQHTAVRFFTPEEASRLKLADSRILTLFDQVA